MVVVPVERAPTMPTAPLQLGLVLVLAQPHQETLLQQMTTATTRVQLSIRPIFLEVLSPAQVVTKYTNSLVVEPSPFLVRVVLAWKH